MNIKWIIIKTQNKVNTFSYEVENKSVFPLFSCSMTLFLLISFSLYYGSN